MGKKGQLLKEMDGRGCDTQRKERHEARVQESVCKGRMARSSIESIGNCPVPEIVNARFARNLDLPRYIAHSLHFTAQWRHQSDLHIATSSQRCMYTPQTTKYTPSRILPRMRLSGARFLRSILRTNIVATLLFHRTFHMFDHTTGFRRAISSEGQGTRRLYTRICRGKQPP